MAGITGALLACLLGGGLVGWMILDAVVEKRERMRCKDLFVPIIGTRIQLRGQHYTKSYEITGKYGRRTVSIHCPVVSLFGKHLKVTSISTPVSAEAMDGQLSTGELVERNGRTFRI